MALSGSKVISAFHSRRTKMISQISHLRKIYAGESNKKLVFDRVGKLEFTIRFGTSR